MHGERPSEEVLDQLEFLLVCKVKDFHDAGYEDVDVETLRGYLMERKWEKLPTFLHEITSDVLSLTYAEVIDYLKLRDVYYAEEESLHKIFSNLI